VYRIEFMPTSYHFAIPESIFLFPDTTTALMRRGATLASSRMLAGDHSVLRVRPNPHSQEARLVGHGKCEVMDSDAGRPQFSGLLEVQRGMTWIALQQDKALVSDGLYLWRQ
jgi:hypothetical protein